MGGKGLTLLTLPAQVRINLRPAKAACDTEQPAAGRTLGRPQSWTRISGAPK